MDAKLQQLCDNLVEDRKVLKKKMFWEFDSNAMAVVSSVLCQSNGVRADGNRYKKCKKILKKHANIFSEFRGISEAMVVTKMMISEDPEKYISEALVVYKKLRAVHKLWTSPYMVMTALTIYENGGIEKADENIEKLEVMYKKEKAEHPILTSDNDRPFLAMLIAAGLDDDATLNEVEACYEANKKLTINHDSVHLMAQVMCISTKSTEEKTAFVKSYIEKMKKVKKPISKEYGLACVGAMTLLDKPIDQLVAECAEVDDYLKHKKGFRWYSLGTRIRRMYAQLLVMMTYLPESGNMLNSVIAGTMAMVIMEEIIMMIIITNAAASSAHSSSSSAS